MKLMATCRAALLLLALAAVAAAADVIHLKDGTRKEGTIVEETETHYVMETFGTRFTIKKVDVKKVERGKKSPNELFQEKYAKIDKKDPLELLALADWCKENGLEKRARQVYEKVLDLEPDNEEAHEGLGHTKVEGKWLTREAARARRQGGGKEAGEEPGGGPEGKAPEKEGPAGTAQGAEEVKARAKEMVAANKAEAEKLAKDMIAEIGIDEATAAITDHYVLAGQVTQEVVDQLAELAEVVYWDLGRRFNHNPEFDLYRSFKIKHLILYFKNAQDYSDGYDYAAKKWAPGLMKSKGMAMQAGVFEASGIPFTIHRHLNQLNSHLANEVAHSWIWWHVRPQTQEAREQHDRFMPWLQEGLGIWSAMFHTGQNFMYRTTVTKYEAQIEIAKKRGESPHKLQAKEWAQGKTKAVYSRNLHQMMMQELNRLDFIDLTLAFSVLDYAILTRQDELKAFFLNMRRKPYLDAWKEGFGEDLVPSSEDKLREWVKANY